MADLTPVAFNSHRYHGQHGQWQRHEARGVRQRGSAPVELVRASNRNNRWNRRMAFQACEPVYAYALVALNDSKELQICRIEASQLVNSL